MNIDAIRKYFESEENREKTRQYFKKLKQKDDKLEEQIDRFKDKYNFKEFIEKVLVKYNSKEYRERWYSRGIEPREELLWFLFNFTKKYGRVCMKDEWEKYGNTFTGELYYYEGYYFNLMHGQGSVVNVHKEEK